MHEESAPRNRHQASAKPNCAHKQLKKQMVGEQLWYACECGQKFRIEAWDGKVSVLAPPDPRKDLAGPDFGEPDEVLAGLDRINAHNAALPKIIWSGTNDSQEGSTGRVYEDRLMQQAYDEGFEQGLEEMRGAKRPSEGQCQFCQHRAHEGARCGVLITMSMCGPHGYCECDGKADWVERHAQEGTLRDVLAFIDDEQSAYPANTRTWETFRKLREQVAALAEMHGAKR